MLVTSTDYRNPYRPWPVALFNRAGRLARKAGLGRPLNVDRMVASAQRKTGLSDFGDDWFLEPLHVLVDSINSEARLTTLGNMLQNARFISALSTRLRVQELLGKNPEIRDIELGKIILIAGLQRTGTTALHRLIGADPRIRALYSWEMLNPLPLPNEEAGNPVHRKKRGKMAEKTIRYLAPEFFAIHPIEYDAPEEDIFLLDLSFASQIPEATMHVPTYAKWLEKQDQTRSYEYMRTMLQVLHWLEPCDAWVLKTPQHTEWLDVVLKVFPGILIAQTHRDPKKSIASFCSMVAHGRGILSDHVDPDEIADHWIEKSLRSMRRSIEVRKSVKSSQFIDISYYDLIREPAVELHRIYGRAGIEFDEKAERWWADKASENRKDWYGKHIYKLNSFSIDAAKLDRCCDFYRSEYGIPHETSVFSSEFAESETLRGPR